jgi:hypothetical protein
VFEAKHTSSFVKADELLARYMPQLQHNMAVAQCTIAVLSRIFGNGKWECFEVSADWLYQANLFEAEQQFWECVQTGVGPVPAAVPNAPRPVGVREVCLEGNNRWATSAADWLQHRLAARKHAEATSSLKELVEDDVAPAFGHGIEARRSSALARNGIAKDHLNDDEDYAYRSIDDVLNRLSPLLAEHKLCVLARVLGAQRCRAPWTWRQAAAQCRCASVL